MNRHYYSLPNGPTNKAAIVGITMKSSNCHGNIDLIVQILYFTNSTIDQLEVKMEIATLSPKFQLCIPKTVREEMHLYAGQQFICIPKNDGIYLIPKKGLNDIRGILKGADTRNTRDRRDRI
jgi:AbrB family looped-hinge helix DNA binding protein